MFKNEKSFLIQYSYLLFKLFKEKHARSCMCAHTQTHTHTHTDIQDLRGGALGGCVLFHHQRILRP